MTYQAIEIIGNAGRNAEMRYLPDGTPVVNTSIAVNEKVNGEDRTTWYNVAFWGSMTKGAQHIVTSQTVFVRGTPQVEQWTDSGGNPRASIKITAHEFRFIGGRPEGAPASSADATQTPEEIADEIPF